MISQWDSIARARSLLFVPGHRPDRFEKARLSGADIVVLDIEDSVGPDLKALARRNVHRWLVDGGVGIVRINGVNSRWHEEDLVMLDGRQCAVMLPKASSPDQVAGVVERLPAACVVPVLETADSILRAREVCAAPRVVRAIFGNADLSSELGIDLANQPALAYARSQIVLASAACGLAPPVDGATAAVTDDRALAADVEHAMTMGFTGKSCLHPRQVPVVNDYFSPSAEEVHWARNLVAAAGDGSVTLVNSQVVGKPVIERARRLLARVDP